MTTQLRRELHRLTVDVPDVDVVDAALARAKRMRGRRSGLGAAAAAGMVITIVALVTWSLQGGAAPTPPSATSATPSPAHCSQAFPEPRVNGLIDPRVKTIQEIVLTHLAADAYSHTDLTCSQINSDDTMITVYAGGHTDADATALTVFLMPDVTQDPGAFYPESDPITSTRCADLPLVSSNPSPGVSGPPGDPTPSPTFSAAVHMQYCRDGDATTPMEFADTYGLQLRAGVIYPDLQGIVVFGSPGTDAPTNPDWAMPTVDQLAAIADDPALRLLIVHTR